VPSKPPAFDRQGLTVDDLIDSRRTSAEAIEITKQASPAQPCSVRALAGDKKGTIQLQDRWAVWLTGAAFIPTGMLYVPSRPTQRANLLPTAADGPSFRASTRG
jgi:hypothetical protein